MENEARPNKGQLVVIRHCDVTDPSKVNDRSVRLVFLWKEEQR